MSSVHGPPETAEQPFLRADLLQQPGAGAPGHQRLALQGGQPAGRELPGVPPLSGLLPHQPPQGAAGAHRLLPGLKPSQRRGRPPSQSEGTAEL